jgi:4-hydroxy-2-oxoheptanedioate aldolase
MQCLDELLAVPGLDAVLIGPHDLSHSLGIPERYDDPRFENAVLTIVRKARASGVGAGIHWWGPLERFGPWMAAGLNLIICSADITAMQAKLSADVETLRNAVGDAPNAPRKSDAI